MCFCTSCIFCVKRLECGFSVPSTTPVCSAWYTSEKAITCGSAPTARICDSSTLDDWMRIFRPLKSSGVFSGLLAEKDLKPLSQ